MFYQLVVIWYSLNHSSESLTFGSPEIIKYLTSLLFVSLYVSLSFVRIPKHQHNPVSCYTCVCLLNEAPICNNLWDHQTSLEPLDYSWSWLAVIRVYTRVLQVHDHCALSLSLSLSLSLYIYIYIYIYIFIYTLPHTCKLSWHRGKQQIQQFNTWNSLSQNIKS